MRLLRILAPALLLTLGAVTVPAPSVASVAVGISVGFAPPLLPIYEQPPIPGPGYYWTPGYWGWGLGGYYWVPGTWVLPPAIGLLWTPPWWGWSGGAFVFNAGYWGPTIGFYGGIDYGFGYFGSGYVGGRWDNGQFFYNREVNNFGNTNIRNAFSDPVGRNASTTNRTSFNGGSGGTTARPTAQEQAAANQHHVQSTALQTQNLNAARSNRSLLASNNHGNPSITATSRAGRFSAANSANTVGTSRGSTVRNAGQSTSNVGTAPRASTNVTHGGTGRFGSPSANSTRSPSRGSFAHTAPTNIGRSGPSTIGRSAPRNFGSAPANASRAPSRGNFAHAAPTNIGRTGPSNIQRSAPRNFGSAAPRNFGSAAPRNSGARAPANFGRAAAPHAVQGNARQGGGGGGGNQQRKP